MIEYSRKANTILTFDKFQISSFIQDNESNIDIKTVKSFGEEWDKFDEFSTPEIQQIGDDYFDLVADKHISKSKTIALDVGCGSGRWSKYLADKVKFIEAIDPSSAVFKAARLLQKHRNVRITQASAENIPFPDNSFDFVFSLGVLHHIPDTQLALHHCIQKLKKNGSLLIYLYYNLDNRNISYKMIFYLSSVLRGVISRLPGFIKRMICDLITFFIYLPISRLAGFLKAMKIPFWKSLPLAYYHDKSMNILRNDALDRFGTPLEQRFSRKQVEEMLNSEGMRNIVFSEKAPYWHVISQKA